MLAREGTGELVRIARTRGFAAMLDELTRRHPSPRSPGSGSGSSGSSGPSATRAACQTCRTEIRPDRRHCSLCHFDVAEGQHGGVARDSPLDPDRRKPRETVPCPACVGAEGYEAARRRALFRSLTAGAELPRAAETWTLETFRQVAGGEREKLAALAAAVSYVDGELFRMTPPFRSLYLHGSVGGGKTGLAIAILKARMHQGQPGSYATLPDLLERIKRTFDRERGEAGDTTESLLRKLQDIDLLVLDDIGVERPTEFVLEKLFQVLDGRMRNMRETVYTSNLGFDGLRAHLGERIMERVKYQTWDVEVGGRNLRNAALGRIAARAIGDGRA